ncbi:acetylornithine deacetylase/succinyl-diaminopimelate desuccinylase-like protein [Knoellia remsis]|uniref:Acetylornithine deacetylase/succinyl-diaminopimelate desuccinylase-like protein n=2 Tax=Knoellia remsis TaxID=407159 RepID=A0A2T0UXP3_9MICO|nr:dipeptidase [Knoellia remsis]PRY62682.1 acetylornithine deacetylase/succinyl-diaminopimelate desuccinylase-like protein [Knoellia remsis]
MSEPAVPASLSDLRETVRGLMPQLRADLEALTRIPSVSLPAFDQSHVDASAEATAELLRAEGLDVEIVREGGAPAVIAHIDGPEGAPTVMLYAHHDVQPPGDEADWESAPFEPTERDGRLYGRGAADDKAGIMAHIAALRAHRGNLPVGVTVFVEGEEEVGSDSLMTILERHGDKLAADAIVLADSTNWEIGTPALTTTLRGLIRVVVTVSTLDHGIHSGMFGGAVPDAVTALVRLISTLHDEDGNVTVAGLKSGEAADLDFSEERLREESGLLDGVSTIGSGSLLSRMWTKPSLTTIGINAPSVEKSSNTLVPTASAKLSMRIAPDENPQDAFAALEKHLLDNAPWGARVEVSLDDQGAGFAADVDGPIYDEARAAFADAWGTEPVDIGVGGSIPFVAAFAERFPDAAILVTGVEDPDTRAHGANESLHLGEFENVCVAEAALFARLGARASEPA